MRREQWQTRSEHHGYIDHYANRCERFTIESGHTQIVYEAELWLTDPDDVIVLTGSIYLLGEVLCRLEPQRGPGEGRLQDF